MTLIHDFRLHSHSNPAGRMICSRNQIVCLPIHCPLVSLSHDLITTYKRRAVMPIVPSFSFFPLSLLPTTKVARSS